MRRRKTDFSTPVVFTAIAATSFTQSADTLAFDELIIYSDSTSGVGTDFTLVIQGSTDNVSWTDLYSAAGYRWQIGSGATEAFFFVVYEPVPRFVRGKIEIGVGPITVSIMLAVYKGSVPA